jgi:hypothetical protein
MEVGLETRTGRSRPTVRGKFIYRGAQKVEIRGVTYGTFRPDEAGVQFPARATVAEDFATMAMSGINAVRTYTVPPGWLLDLAADHALLVLIGVPDGPRRLPGEPLDETLDREDRPRGCWLLRRTPGRPGLRNR